MEVLDSEENPDLRFGLPKLKELILRSPQYRFNITRYPIIEDSPMLESFSLLDLSHEVNLYLYYLKSSSLSSLTLGSRFPAQFEMARTELMKIKARNLPNLKVLRADYGDIVEL